MSATPEGNISGFRVRGDTYYLEDTDARETLETVDACLKHISDNVGVLLPNNHQDWVTGKLSPSEGTAVSDSENKTIRTGHLETFPVSISTNEGYKFEVFVYHNNKAIYDGIIQSDGTLAYETYFYTNTVYLNVIPAGSTIRIVLAKTDDSTITVPENYNLLFMNSSGNDIRNLVSTDNNLLYVGKILEGYKLESTPASAITPTADQYMNTSDYIPVTGGETLVAHSFRRYWWYKADRTPVSNLSSGNLSDFPVFDENTGAKLLNVSPNAHYIRFSYKVKDNTLGPKDENTYLFRRSVYEICLKNLIDEISTELSQAEASIPEIDANLNISGKAADAKATGDALQNLDDAVDGITESVGDIQDDINSIDTTLGELEDRVSETEDALFDSISLTFEQGSISTNSGQNASSTSANNPKRVRSATPFFVKDNYEYVSVPAGFAVTVLTYRDREAVQANYIEALSEVEDKVDFSAIKHKYVRLLVAKEDHDALLTPAETEGLFEIHALKTDMATPAETKISQNMGANLLFEGDTVNGVTFAAGSTPILNSNANFNTTDFIPVIPGETFLAHDFRRFWVYDSNKAGFLTKNLNTEYTAVDSLSGVKYLTMPEDAAYIRISYNCVEDTEPYLYRMKYFDSRYLKAIYNDKLKYVAIGSSTTEGTYSTIGYRDSSGRTDKGFPYWIALENNYTLSNIGHGGGGWLNHGNRDDNNSLSLLDNILKAQTYVEGTAYAVGQCAIKDGDICRYTRTNDGYAWESLNLGSSVSEAFSNKSVITVLYGSNDYKAQWKNNDTERQQWTLGSVNERWLDPSYERTVTLGDATYGYTSDLDQKLTVIGAMSIVIETLAREAPKAQIIIVLPGNFKKLGLTDSSAPVSDEIEIVTQSNKHYAYAKFAYNYAAGTHNWENKTLADYRTAIRECAEYYGLNVVDMSMCAANRLNIDSLLGDGIHPTVAYYKQIGHTLAPFIR